jgi:hypothetical protein
MRILCIAVAAFFFCGAAFAEPPTHPFASSHVPFPRGTLRPTQSTDQLDQAIATFYDVWKDRYVVPGCGAGQVRIRADAAEGKAFTVSEGQGYGITSGAIRAATTNG